MFLLFSSLFLVQVGKINTRQWRPLKDLVLGDVIGLLATRRELTAGPNFPWRKWKFGTRF